MCVHFSLFWFGVARFESSFLGAVRGLLFICILSQIYVLLPRVFHFTVPSCSDLFAAVSPSSFLPLLRFWDESKSGPRKIFPPHPFPAHEQSVWPVFKLGFSIAAWLVFIFSAVFAEELRRSARSGLVCPRADSGGDQVLIFPVGIVPPAPVRSFSWVGMPTALFSRSCSKNPALEISILAVSRLPARLPFSACVFLLLGISLHLILVPPGPSSSLASRNHRSALPFPLELSAAAVFGFCAGEATKAYVPIQSLPALSLFAVLFSCPAQARCLLGFQCGWFTPFVSPNLVRVIGSEASLLLEPSVLRFEFY
jgi:hypothetical protein